MVNEIIPKYPKYKDKYLAAARTWRLPFWDWAKNPRMPQFARYKSVSIAIGGEPKVEIANPLYQFRMPNDKKMKAYGVGSIVNFDGGEPFEVGALVDLLCSDYSTNTLSFIVWRVHCNQPLPI